MVAGSQELNDSVLVGGQDYDVSVHPANEPHGHKRGHVGEVQLGGGRESFVIGAPVATAGHQDKLVSTQSSVRQHYGEVTGERGNKLIIIIYVSNIRSLIICVLSL